MPLILHGPLTDREIFTNQRSIPIEACYINQYK